MIDAVVSLMVRDDLFEKVEKSLKAISRRSGVEYYIHPDLSYRTLRRLLPGCYRGEEKYVTYVLTFHRISVGALPSSNGYTFVAKIEHTAAGNIVSCAPGQTADPSWRTAEPHCEHCAVNRRRNETFVLGCPDGSLKQVGRNCLADFIMTSPERLIAAAELSDFFPPNPDGESGGYSGPVDPGVARFVECAVASIERHGFRPAKSENSTRSNVNWLLWEPSSTGLDHYRYTKILNAWKAEQPTEEHRAKAAKVLEWIAENVDSSDYIHNLRVAVALPIVGKHAGLLASLPAAYDRAMGVVAAKKIEAEKQAKIRQTPANILGSVGSKIEASATLVRRTVVDGYYGSTVLCQFDIDGSTAVWFASGKAPATDDIGTRFAIKGTVKKHDSRNGIAQTVLTRVKFEKSA